MLAILSTNGVPVKKNEIVLDSYTRGVYFHNVNPTSQPGNESTAWAMLWPISYSYVNYLNRKYTNNNENAAINTCQADFLTSDKNSTLCGAACTASPRRILDRFSRNHCVTIPAAICSIHESISRLAILERFAARFRAESSKSCSALSEKSNRSSSDGRPTGSPFRRRFTSQPLGYRELYTDRHITSKVPVENVC